MAFCKSCGNALNDEDMVCPACGTPVKQSAAAGGAAASDEPTVTPIEEPIVAKASGVLNIGQLVWAIINTVLCWRLVGIVALVMTIIAKDAPTAADEKKKLKTALICNIVSTAGSVLFGIIFVFVYLLAIIASM